ncbi:MAG: aspartyl protease family protein [Candidatus Eremiobacteraeota bacterium]|nr:aspartyl protease family protein [Candidatus Eremiobacteraeota bacterium]
MRFALRLAALPALWFLLLGAAGPPISVPALLARMRAASGEPYRFHVQSVAHDPANREAVIRADFAGLRFVSRSCESNVCTGTYFDGVRTFSVNLNDTALPRGNSVDPYLRALRTVSSYAFTDNAFELDGGNVSDAGLRWIGKKSYRVLAVRAVSSIPLLVYVDPASALITSVRSSNDSLLFGYRDYRRVGPLMLPFEIDNAQKVAQHYDSRTVSPDPFAPPRGLIPQVNERRPAMKMLTESDTPIGDCKIADRKLRCLIDTGSSGLSLSVQAAEQLHLEPFGGFEARGLGHYATGVVRTGPLEVGNAVFGTANYLVLNDIHQYGYDVVLGADILANSNVVIDYNRREVLFGFDFESNGASVIPISFENFVPVVPVTLGSTLVPLAIDTGDESGINLSYDYYKLHSDLFSATEARDVSGVGGNSEELIGEIPHVQVGSFRVENQRIGATRKLKATANGHLGGGFLAHFRVTFDYARSRLGLVARGNDSAVHDTHR